MEMTGVSRRIWDMKYRLKEADGTPVDNSIEDTWDRIARTLASVEKDSSLWEPVFRHALEDFRFLPAGRIIAGAGSDRDVTLFNCFVMGTIPDDMGGIFESLREAALTLQAGGGIGYDFSTLRPKGAIVHRVGADASGPVSFMDVWDAMCRTIMSAGHRRGAMMGVMRCDHPDIEHFIDAKAERGRLTNFNLSVLITDAFMEAVDTGGEWPLVFGGRTYRTVRARDLWDRIMASTYDHAEPGVVFIDRINARNNLHYCETIAATNPCGEQPLPPYGACLLGSINLAAFVKAAFQPDAALDEAEMAKTVRIAVRMLDNAIDASRFPLDAQKAEAMAKRRIGLGVTGLADALAECRVRYGSAESLTLIDRWLALIQREAYLTSTELAAEKGAFPLFDRKPYLEGETVSALDSDIRQAIAEKGIRNALLTSIAPTGTISLLANNVSSGIEPIFALTHKRRVLQPDGTHEEHEIADCAYRLFRETFGEEAELPEYFIDAQRLAPDDHLAVQAAAQRRVDSSISKTINLPESVSFEDFKDVYRRAYALGAKGCTTYRPNPVTGSVLSTGHAVKPVATPVATVEKHDAEAAKAHAGKPPAGKPHHGKLSEEQPSIVYMTTPLARPSALEGLTYKLNWPESDHAIYITINDIVQDGRRRPFEVFINSKNMEHYAWTVALTRMISAVFRRGGDVSFVVEELKAVFDPRGGYWLEGEYVPSLLAAIGGVIEHHMVEIGFLGKDDVDRLKEGAARRVAGEGPPGRSCPKCAAMSVVRQEGCDTCLSCGWSRCG